MLNKLLQEFGLSSKEADIYLACLSLGASPVGTIAKKAGLKRSTAYANLTNLVTKGVMQSFDKNNSNFYICVAPERLAARYEKRAKKFGKALEGFQALSNSYAKPKVEYFEGISGIQEMYMATLNYKDTIRAFLNADEIDDTLTDRLYNTYLPARVEKGITAEMIVPDSTKNRMYKDVDSKSLKKTRIVSKANFNMGSQVMLFGKDKVATFMYSKKEMSGVVIHSENYFKTMNGLFNLLRKG